MPDSMKLLSLMAKSPQTPLSRTARLLDLVPYLSSHQGIELRTLAQDFDVSQSQMIADLTTLWMCGLPGYTPLELMDLSFDSGFVTIHNAETLARPRTLNDEESIALLLGLDLVIESLPQERTDLKTSAMELVGKLSARTSIPAKLSAIPAMPGSVRSLIESALLKKSALKIVYHSSYSDTISTRLVVPLELRVEGGHEYVWALCHNAHATRVFRLDRIQSAEVAPLPRAQPMDVAHAQSAMIPYTIRIHSRPREVMERFSLDKDSLDKDLQLTSYSREWIRRSVLASAGSVEIVGPDDLAQEVAAAAGAILKEYIGK